MQSCLWQMVRSRATDDNVLDIPEGSAPCGRDYGQLSRDNAPPPPPHPPVSLEQLLATQNELMTLLIQNEACHGGKMSTAPPITGREHVLLRVLGDSPATLLWGKDPLEADD
jgi:hypothetical protein